MAVYNTTGAYMTLGPIVTLAAYVKYNRRADIQASLADRTDGLVLVFLSAFLTSISLLITYNSYNGTFF